MRSPFNGGFNPAAVTAGSTVGLTYTYWTNAEQLLPMPHQQMATAGTHIGIKEPLNAGCFNIKPVQRLTDAISYQCSNCKYL
jgi:hypothetical protein